MMITNEFTGMVSALMDEVPVFELIAFEALVDIAVRTAVNGISKARQASFH